jgi:hypothetical protein
MFPEVDPVLGPEMRSTGEVLGLAPTFGLAYFKAQEAAPPALPLQGTVLISVADKDKPAILEIARQFHALGFRIKATQDTQTFLQTRGVPAGRSYKVHEAQRPDIVDEIKNREIQLVVNTPVGKQSQFDDAYRRPRLRPGHRRIPRRPRRREIAPGIPPRNPLTRQRRYLVIGTEAPVRTANLGTTTGSNASSTKTRTWLRSGCSSSTTRNR